MNLMMMGLEVYDNLIPITDDAIFTDNGCIISLGIVIPQCITSHDYCMYTILMDSYYIYYFIATNFLGKGTTGFPVISFNGKQLI